MLQVECVPGHLLNLQCQPAGQLAAQPTAPVLWQGFVALSMPACLSWGSFQCARSSLPARCAAV